MKIDISSFPETPARAIELATKAESLGYDALWTAEAAHNPFLPLTLAASHTQNLTLGTQIAVAFPRSPMVTAQIAWDLAAQSKGRFILGLGTQVRAHITRRFSEEWGQPVARMKDYILALRAIWQSFQSQTGRLRYRGEFYTFGLLSPFFTPQTIEHPDIPVYVAGVNEKICAMAGEVADGLHAHGFHTADYLREVVLAKVQQGLSAAGREREAFEMVVPVFVATGSDDAALQNAIHHVKSRIAFYASTPSYKAVMQMHGWDDIRQTLSQMARSGQWEAMPDQISDDMLDTIATVGPLESIAERLRERYKGLADRICFGWETPDAENDPVWAQLADDLQHRSHTA